VLHWPRSQPEVLAAQLERIVTLAPLKAVNIAVLALGEPIDAVPWNNFVIYEGDEPFVSIELVHRPEALTEPHQIDLYRRLYNQMWQRQRKLLDVPNAPGELFSKFGICFGESLHMGG
jgi:hypothetical protein